MTVGQIVRKRREALGLTLAAVAGAVGTTKGYLSMIENHRVGNPPSRGVLEGLERALGITAGDLRRAADWQSTPEPVRQEVQRLSDDADRGRALAEWIKQHAPDARSAGAGESAGADAMSPSEAAGGSGGEGGEGGEGGARGGRARSAGRDLDALYRSGQLFRRVEAVLEPQNRSADSRFLSPGGAHPGDADAPIRYRVPLISQVAAGPPTGHTDLDYPAQGAEQHLDVPDVAGPDSFATRIAGQSMSPHYAEGDIVVCSASAKVEDGSDCFVRLEPDHDSTFKRVYFDVEAGTIRLQPLNPDYTAKVVPREQVAGMYRAVWKFSKV